MVAKIYPRLFEFLHFWNLLVGSQANFLASHNEHLKTHVVLCEGFGKMLKPSDPKDTTRIARNFSTECLSNTPHVNKGMSSKIYDLKSLFF